MLSCFSPRPGPDLPLDIAIHYAPHHARPQRSLPTRLCEWPRNASPNWPHNHRLAQGHQGGPRPLCPYWQHWETLTIEDGLVLQGEALIIPPAKRERTLHQLHQFHQGITKSQLLTHGSFFWPGINKAIKEVVCQCETCTQFQEPECCSTPHTYTNTITPMCRCVPTDTFTLEGVDHHGSRWLLLEDDLSPMPSTWPEQCQQGRLTAEGEMFSEHGIPKVPSLWQWPSVCECPVHQLLYVLVMTHKTSSPHYPQSNGFAEACIKSVKHALQWAKYSGADPHLALLALWAMPIDSKLPSPAELMYQCQLRTTIPAKICNSNPSAPQVHEQIDACSESAKAQADKCSKTLAPLYAGQPVATYDTLQKIWVPATVIHILPWNSYLVCTSNGSTYFRMQRHLCEYSVKAADTVPSGTTATLQALSRHCFLAEQPASPPPAPCMQPTSAAPATPVTQMKQAPAVPAMPAVQKHAMAPKSVTSHATPVQAQRSGHVCMAPRRLIQVI